PRDVVGVRLAVEDRVRSVPVEVVRPDLCLPVARLAGGITGAAAGASIEEVVVLVVALVLPPGGGARPARTVAALPVPGGAARRSGYRIVDPIGRGRRVAAVGQRSYRRRTRRDGRDRPGRGSRDRGRARWYRIDGHQHRGSQRRGG